MPSAPKRRRFQFSLRTLLIGMAVAATLCPIVVRCVREWNEWQQRLDAKHTSIEVQAAWKWLRIGRDRPLTDADVRRALAVDDTSDRKR